jgi:hypothetical protein
VFRSRIVLIVLLAGAAVTGAAQAGAPDSSSVDAAGTPPASAKLAAVPVERQRLAARVVHAWDPDGEAGAPGTLDTEAVGAWAEPMLHDLDPSNPRWNSTHPQWPALRDIVSADIAPDLKVQVSALQTQLSDSMSHDIAQRMNEADLTELLRYFSSADGRRFVAFQGQVTKLFGAGMRTALQSGQGAKTAPPPADVMKGRLQLLMLSTSAQITQSWLEEARRTNADTSGFQAIGFIAAAVAVREGDELDALRLRYASHLDEFDRFNQSPLGKRFFAAFGEASKSVGLVAANALHSFQRNEEAKYLEHWKSAYQATVAAPATTALKP